MSTPNLYAGQAAQYERKLTQAFQAIFEDTKERFYFERPDGTGYMMDTGNRDARTEGMSYGMMMAVQMDRRDLFDRLWLFSVKYMLLHQGPHEGYFAWSVQPDGTHNAEGPAPDGEEYYAMALFFASNRWGEHEPPYDYAAQGRAILRRCVHQHELVKAGRAMWDSQNKLIRFIPEVDFSDPSYHLPHFYALFGELADREDRPFWRDAAKRSREYIARACDKRTGMAAEYAEYDGKPRLMPDKPMTFYSDAYRVAMNIGLDAAWNGATPELSACADRLQVYLLQHPELMAQKTCLIDGTPIGIPVLHPLALLSTTAAGSLAARGEQTRTWLDLLLTQSPRTGARRYYDNCLYFFSLLMLGGRYRMYL